MADENFPGDAVKALLEQGHDVLWVRTVCPGVSDSVVLSRAQGEDRIVVTFDKDFGELAFRFLVPAACGVVLFRLPPVPPARLTEIVVTALTSRNDWVGYFAVVELDRIRIKPLPGPRKY